MEDLKDLMQENLEYYLEQKKIIISRLFVLPRGKIKEKKINGDSYFYLQYRQAGRVVDRYIGKRAPEDLLENLSQRKMLEIELKKVREAIKLLDKKDAPGSDLMAPIEGILRKFTEVGLWDSGVEIIGAWCFLIYTKYLPVEKYPLKTQDIDFLIPMPYKGAVFDLSAYFRQLGFQEHFNPDGSMFFSTADLKIEFLAPQKVRDDKSSVYIRELSIRPQALRLVDILLEDAIDIKVSPGIWVKVPSPGSFMLHKLLIAASWKRAKKKEKDLKQAIYIGQYILSDEPESRKLLQLWQHFSPSWKRKVKKALVEARPILPLKNKIIDEIEKRLF